MDNTMLLWGGIREWLFPAGEILTILAAAWITTKLWGH